MTETMVAAEWSELLTDEELAADLEMLGVTSGEPLDQARRDAFASVLLRRMAEEIDAIAQTERSRDTEIAFIRARYDIELARRGQRVTTLRLGVEAIASHTKDAGGYSGKKKTRDVGAGTYGYKSYAAGPELVDEPAYVAWAEQHAPETLRVKPTMSLAQAREYLTDTELAGVKREIMKADVSKLIATDPVNPPPGYRVAPAVDEYFAKPLPLAAIATER